MVEHNNPLSQRYPHDQWKAAMDHGGPIGPESLSDLALAASGLQAVLRIVVASRIESDCVPGSPLQEVHVGGLLDAAQALAAMLGNGLFSMGERMENTAKAESDRKGVPLHWRMALVPSEARKGAQ